MKTEIQFIYDCNSNICNRHTFKSNNCKKEQKQERCYRRWIKEQEIKQQKIQKEIQDKREKYQKFLNGEIDLEYEVDDEYEEFRKQVWIRDCGNFDGVVKHKDWKNYCRIWNILTDSEKKYFDEHYSDAAFINENLDVCHIQERSSHPELKYTVENAVICGRMFHSRLDAYTSPVYARSITKEERNKWFENAKRGERK